MFVRRYLLLTSSFSTIQHKMDGPDIIELPHKSLKDAADALRNEFEAAVRRVFGEDHEIRYGYFGEAHLVGYKQRAMTYHLDPVGYSFFVVGQSGECYVGGLKEITVQLSADEMEKGYREWDRRYLIMDAEAHLYEKLGYVADAEENSEEESDNNVILQRFQDHYGFSLSEAVCEGSEFYLLDDIVKLFEHKHDCNLDDNSVWDTCVQAVLNRVDAGRCS